MAVAVVLGVALQSQFFQIQDIDLQVMDADPLQQKYLNPLIASLNKELSSMKGQSWSSVQFVDIYKQLKNKKWIQEVKASRQWPSSLRVQITPEKIYFLYLDTAGKTYPVIENGQLLEVVDWRQAPDVVLTRDKVFEKDISLRKKTVEVLQQLPASGALSRQTVSQLYYNNKEGFGFSLIQSEMLIKLGEDHIAQKSSRVAQVLEYLNANQFDARVIDANLSKKVLVRLRKGP